jgi:hypothetical protein
LKGWALKIETFLGSEMATSERARSQAETCLSQGAFSRGWREVSGQVSPTKASSKVFICSGEEPVGAAVLHPAAGPCGRTHGPALHQQGRQHRGLPRET